MPLNRGDKPQNLSIGVFGGGIAGLTAAHELARRGFQVTVYEKSSEFGGMAASQYGKRPGSSTGEIPKTAPTDPDALAGEHGFRFFPAFYRHLTDTMRRTPVTRPKNAIVTTGPSVRIEPYTCLADRLIPTNVQGVALEDGRDLFTYARGGKKRSLEETLDELATTMDYLGSTDQDIARLLFKLVQYMTSSEARRGQLEAVSWWDFLEGPKFSPNFQRYLETVPRALVAMTSKKSDARTQGSVLLQLFLDGLTEGEEVDRTLDGPTSERWIDPWVEWLGSTLNVTFKTGVEFFGFAPVLGSFPPKFEGKTISATGAATVQHDAYVLALPHQIAQAFVSPLLVNLDEAMQLSTGVVDTSLGKLRAFPGNDERTGGPLAWLNGMQFYLAQDVRFLPGHVYYPDSAWGLSSISQAQFWGDNFPVTYQRGGVLSVDVGAWFEPAPTGSTVVGKSASECSKQELADEVWRQLRVATVGNQYLRVGAAHTPWPGNLPAVTPNYMVDRYMQYGALAAPPSGNDGPMLIARPGEYRDRPGFPDAYRVHLDQIVLAGPWMQTYTRLTTMEAANESARHAVNAILARLDFPGEGCTIWNPEEHEPVPYERLKSLDARLVACGVPHLFDVLSLFSIIDCLVPTTPHSHADLGFTEAGDGECCGTAAEELCATESPLDLLLRLTGLDVAGLEAATGLCWEDLLEAERRAKNAGVMAQDAQYAGLRAGMQGRGDPTFIAGGFKDLLATLAGRPLADEVLAMMQDAFGSGARAIEDGEEPARAVEARQGSAEVPELSELGVTYFLDLMRRAEVRLETDGVDPRQARVILGSLRVPMRLYIPGYLARWLRTVEGRAYRAMWGEGQEQEGGARAYPPDDAPLRMDAWAEVERVLPGLLPRAPVEAREKVDTKDARIQRGQRAIDGGSGPAEPRPSDSGHRPVTSPPGTHYLADEILGKMPRARPFQRRRQRHLPRLLAALADRK